MARMWTGPCKELLADYDDLLTRRLHRRASRHGIQYIPAHDGRSARVESFEKIAGRWHFTHIGDATGRDVPNLFLNCHLEFTPIDAELIEIASAMVLRRTEEVGREIGQFFTRVERQADDLATVISNVRA